MFNYLKAINNFSFLLIEVWLQKCTLFRVHIRSFVKMIIPPNISYFLANIIYLRFCLSFINNIISKKV